MRIHTDSTITHEVLRTAARLADAVLDTAELKGSRSRAQAYEIKLRGNSRRRPNHYNGDGQYAATWDQWGVFLGYLFEKDPSMLIGSGPHAEDADRFEYRTGGRFADPENFEHSLSHDHVFRFAGIPRQQTCTRCGAVFRWDY